MIKLVIFDLDGTLVNSIYDLANAVNNGLETLGYPIHDVDKFYHFVGNGTLKLAERALPEEHRNSDEIEKLHSLFAKNYEKCCLDQTRPYDRIIETINILKINYNIKLAVASNKTDTFARYIIDNLFLAGTFDVVVGKNDKTPAKPDPQMIYNIIDEFSFDKSDIIFVGDSNVDVQTAHNAGVPCIGCEWGFRGRQELISAGADYLAEKPEDISDIISKY